MAAAKNLPRTTSPCANCGQPAGPRFCPHCGQEVEERHGPLWQVTREFVSDWLSLDSQLLRSLGALLRPARLSELYLSGKRAPFLRPFRLYLLASVVLFSTALTLEAPDFTELEITIGGQRIGGDGPAAPSNASEEVHLGSRSAKLRKTIDLLNTDSFIGRFMLRLAGDRIDRLRSMPPQQAVDMLFAGLRRTLPPMLILFVPLLALGLKLLYIRRRAAHHLYLDHLVFAAHFQAALFFALSAAWLLSRLAQLGLTGTFAAALLAFLALLFGYLPLAMRRFYGQSRLLTAGKALAVLYLYHLLIGLIVSVSVLVGIWGLGHTGSP